MSSRLSIHDSAAVDVDRLSGNEAAVLAGEEDVRRAELGRLADSANGRGRLVPFLHLVLVHRSGLQRRPHGAGADLKSGSAKEGPFGHLRKCHTGWWHFTETSDTSSKYSRRSRGCPSTRVGWKELLQAQFEPLLSSYSRVASEGPRKQLQSVSVGEDDEQTRGLTL